MVEGMVGAVGACAKRAEGTARWVQYHCHATHSAGMRRIKDTKTTAACWPNGNKEICVVRAFSTRTTTGEMTQQRGVAKLLEHTVIPGAWIWSRAGWCKEKMRARPLGAQN